MDPERTEALETLRRSAESILSRPEDVCVRFTGSPGGSLDFSIMTRPSFGPSVAFAVLRTRPDRSGYSSRRVCRLCWDLPEDVARLESMIPAALKLRPLEPSIDVHVIDAPAEVTAWLMDVANIRVPVRQSAGPWGTDGESTTLRFGEGFNSSEFRWWCGGPDEWAPLVDWAVRIRSRLEKLFAGSRAPPGAGPAAAG